MINNFKGVIFDLDGTLLDSMYIWGILSDMYLEKKGFVPKKGEAERVREMNLYEAAVYFKSEYQIDLPEEEIMEEINKLVEDFYIYDVQLKEGVKEVLEILKKDNIKIAIATLSERYFVEACLKRLGVNDYFDCIVTATEEATSKHEPDIYFKAIENLSLTNDDVIIVEDAYYAIKTAKRAGFFVVAVYDEDSKDEEKKIKHKCDIYLNSLLEWKGELS